MPQMTDLEINEELLDEIAKLRAKNEQLLAILKDVQACPQAAPWLVRTGVWQRIDGAIKNL